MAKIKLLDTDGGYSWFECSSHYIHDGVVTRFEVSSASGEDTYLWYEAEHMLLKIITGAGGGSLFGPLGIPVGAAVGWAKHLYDQDKKPAAYYHAVTGKRLPGIIPKIHATDSNWFRRN